MTQRISRAKRASWPRRAVPDAGEPSAAAAERGAARALPDLHRGLRQPRSGPDLQRPDLSAEAIRLTRTAAPAAARRRGGRPGCWRSCCSPTRGGPRAPGPDGELIPLAEQDRTRWDAAANRRGRGAAHRRAVPRAARPVPAPGGDRRPARRGRRTPRPPTGRRSSRCTSCSCGSPTIRWWRSITPSRPRWSHGPQAGLDLLDGARRRSAAGGPPPARTRSGRTCWRWPEPAAARECYRAAAERTASLPHQRYLNARAARLDGGQ